MSEYDEMLAEANKRLAEQEGGGSNLGDRVELDEGGNFSGRYRGATMLSTANGERTAYLFWDASGAERFEWESAGLAEEMDEAGPQVGDKIAIVRGPDYNFEVNGEPRSKKKYAVAVRASEEPLPAGKAAGDDIPF